jgi:hypothetical protein
MHGLLADAEAMSHVEALIKEDFPDIYVKVTAVFGITSRCSHPTLPFFGTLSSMRTHNVEIGNGKGDR